MAKISEAEESSDDEIEEVQTSRARQEEEEHQENIKSANKAIKKKKKSKKRKDKNVPSKDTDTKESSDDLQGNKEDKAGKDDTDAQDETEFDESFFDQLQTDKQALNENAKSKRRETVAKTKKPTRIIFDTTKQQQQQSKQLGNGLQVVAISSNTVHTTTLTQTKSPYSRTSLINGEAKQKLAKKRRSSVVTGWKRSNKSKIRLLGNLKGTYM